MATTLTTLAIEKGTYVIDVAFTDENGATATPDTMNWTLTDANGTVINSRSAVTITPSTTVHIVLTGNDLAISTYGTKRLLTVQGTYTGDLGTGLPFKAATSFEIENLVVVAD